MKVRSVLGILVVIAVFVVAAADVGFAAPAPSRLLITWRAVDGVAPPAYRDKVLPGINAPIVASVEAVSGGKIIDLGSRTVYWYLDDDFVGGGLGKRTIPLTAPGYTKIMNLRVAVPDYPGGLSVGTTQIQMADPRIVVVAPYPGGLFSQSVVQVRAVPYFFRAPDLGKLSFQWTVNDQAVATQEDPENLTVNLGSGAPAGYSVAIDLLVRQSNDPFFNDRRSVTLTKTNQ